MQVVGRGEEAMQLGRCVDVHWRSSMVIEFGIERERRVRFHLKQIFAFLQSSCSC